MDMKSQYKGVIDLNCDLGESFGRYTLGDDTAMMELITSANVACGFHAGDPMVMQRTVSLAIAHGVNIGAHPGYPDLQGFGRRTLSMTQEELRAMILYQLGALQSFARTIGVPLRHVKPHGALYNTAARDESVAEAIAQAVLDFDPSLMLLTLPGSTLAQAARALGLRVAREGFADRAYQADGTLVPRSHPNALITDAATVAARAVRMVTQHKVTAVTGEEISMQVETLCVHGDTPDAMGITQAVRQALEGTGVRIIPLGR